MSLKSLLRCRRELPWCEVVRLCAGLAGQLEELHRRGLPAPHSLLREIKVSFSHEDEAAKWKRVPVTEWPAFRLTFPAPGLPGDPNRTRIDDDADATHVSADRVSGTTALAALLYELLGGGSGWRGERPPLAGVSEGMNMLLQDALDGTEIRSVTGFWQALVRAAIECPPRSEFVEGGGAPRIVNPLGVSEAGMVLHLIPLSRRIPQLRFSARAWLRIGRDTDEADVLTRFVPETPENIRLTDRLGRIHVLARRVDGWPCFWDGDGEHPSLNKSWLDERRLDADAGTRGGAESLLRLGRRYVLRVACIEQSPVELAKGSSAAGIEGATPACTVVFAPVEQPPARLTAWLGDSVCLDVSDGGLAWSELGSRRNELAILHADGGFWVANLALPRDAVLVAGVPPPAHAAVPLRNGQVIEIKGVRYKIKSWA